MATSFFQKLLNSLGDEAFGLEMRPFSMKRECCF